MNSRYIETSDDTKEKLYFDTHYSIINGYKNLFLARSRTKTNDDIYKKNTHFDEIYSLYLFDRELRALFLKELMRAETFFKNVYFYCFYSEFGDKDSYLELKNYNINNKTISKTIHTIQTIITKHQNKSGDNAIKYSIKNYNYVPFWVLIRFLTFSNIYYLYLGSKTSTRISIAKKISSIQSSKILITEADIEKCVDVFTDFRNICAHDNIFYNHTGYDNENVFYVYNNLIFYLSDLNYAYFTKSLKKIIRHFRNNTPFKIISANQILNIMGFPNNWDL